MGNRRAVGFLCVSVAAFAFSLLFFCVAADAQISSDWLSTEVSISSSAGRTCDLGLEDCGFEEVEETNAEGETEATFHGRMLYRYRYYISYGALAANRVPCPPRSGRSYYTRNCYRARGPVRPYRRGCGRITRCYRDTA